LPRPSGWPGIPTITPAKVVFSYLGDIWMANEDGSNVHRLTDNLAREVYPRFSPDGRSIAFSSNRYGNNDVYVIASTGGTPKRLTYHTGADDVVGWTRDSAQVIFRASRGDGAFPSVATLHQIAATGGPEQSLNLDWGYWGSYSPDGKSLAFNRHPATWSRRHYRGSYAADLWIADIAAKSYTKLLGDEQYNRYWPMWGADGSIYFVADPLPNEKNLSPGSLDVRKSVNNIYKVAAKGGASIQVTRHTDGGLFWPSMSSDGKVIVYEDNFGIWKLDVASGKASEIKLDIASDDKQNEIEFETITNEVDGFDLSPSGRRAVISARGQIFTIATERGDITRVAPDKMASRNSAPTWSPDGKLVAFVSDRSGRDEIWVSDPEGRTPKKITDLDNEKGTLVWTPDSAALLYTAADKKLYSFRNQRRLDGRRPLSRLHLIGGDVERDRFAGGINATMALWALSLRDQDRDPTNRDIDNEAQGLAAEAAARQNTGRGAGSGQVAQIPEVRIDWNGLPRRARPLSVPGTAISGLTPSPEGHSIALTASTAGSGGGRGGTPDANAGRYIINIESGQLTRVPPAPDPPGAGAGRGGRGGGAGGPGGGGNSMAFARDGRTLYFRSGTGLFAAPINLTATGSGAGQAGAGGGRGGGRGGRGGGAPAITEPAATATARQVTYTVNIEVDRKALRAQVFNEGWRIMKNRFYDPKMHGADWNAAKAAYEPLLDYLVDDEELNTVMMMMIGQLNASHTGVTGGGPANDSRPPLQTRHPGFDLAADPSGFYKVTHVYKDGPADHDYLKIKKGDFLISVDDRDLKTSENYWQYFTLAAGSKFHFTVNDKPAREGAWPVTIAPVAGGAFTDLQYARWVTDRREMVTKLSNGEIGYLHIRAMDAPSLRQFQLDLAAQRTKKALVIDQRFNGGGGIDQELLGILAGRQYQYTIGRDAGFQQPRPQNFYGPMVVMQNERSASDAEMFPAGFKALGLGKVVGVPTMGAVIGTGSYTLLNGAAIRTPGSGVWTVTGQNMENYGVPPDVLIDNTPGDFLKGRDAQIEKAVEVLKADMGRKTSTSQQQQ
jgi:tricorn protease